MILSTIVNTHVQRKSGNSLWLCDAIWWHRSWSILVQVMACCLTAPSHYLNQLLHFISKILYHLPVSNFTLSAQTTILHNEFENYNSRTIATSPRGQWVNQHSLSEMGAWISNVYLTVFIITYWCPKFNYGFTWDTAKPFGLLPDQ